MKRQISKSKRPRSGLLDRVYKWLCGEYGTPSNSERHDPLDELVAAVLSQHTSDANSGGAFASLRANFGSWRQVAAAPVEAIADAIRRGGLADQKAPRIKAILAQIESATGALDLDWLAGAPLDGARSFLTSLPGVGPKTAACVLLFALRRPAFPVDTHVHRVARRIGLVDGHASAHVTQDYLESIVSADRMYAYHVNFIRHGRRVCKARRPLCAACGLNSVCRHYRETVADFPGGAA